MHYIYELVKSYPGSPEVSETFEKEAKIVSITGNEEEEFESRVIADNELRYWHKKFDKSCTVSINVPRVLKNSRFIDVYSEVTKEIFEAHGLDANFFKGLNAILKTIEALELLNHAAYIDIEFGNHYDSIFTIVYDRDNAVKIYQYQNGEVKAFLNDEAYNLSNAKDNFKRVYDSYSAFHEYLWYSFMEASELHNKIHNYEPYQEIALSFLNKSTYALEYLGETICYSENEEQDTWHLFESKHDVQSNTLLDVFVKNYYNLMRRI